MCSMVFTFFIIHVFTCVFPSSGRKSWFNGANGAVFGLIIANVAVLTMWKTSDPQWMSKNFVVRPIMFKTFFDLLFKVEFLSWILLIIWYLTI